MQTEFEGCILQCSIGLKLEEVCKVSKELDPLRVHVEPVFWIRPNTKNVYKVIENSNFSSEKDQCQSDNIFGRYVDFELPNTRNSHQPRQSYISCRIGIYNKYKEINVASMSENRISENGARFNQDNFVIDTRDVTKTCQDLSKPSQESSGVDPGGGPRGLVPS